MPPGTPNADRDHETASPSRPCPACGYDLRGIRPIDRDHPCPECAYPSKLDAPSALLLRHADGGWLRRVHLGLRAQVWSFHCYWIMIVGGLVLMLVTILLSTVLETTAPRVLDTLDQVITHLFMIPAFTGLTGIVLHTLGVWLATTPSPDGGHLPSRARSLCRWTGIVFAPLCCLTIPSSAVLSHAEGSWTVAIGPAGGIALASVYFWSARAHCRCLEFHSRRWTSGSPKRYRRVSRNVLLATALAVFIDALLVAEWTAWTPTRQSSRTERWFETWPFWMMFGFAAIVQDAVAPAARGVRHERRRIEARAARAGRSAKQ